MCSLVMSLCSCDLHVTSLNNIYNTLNSSRLTVVQLTQRLIFGCQLVYSTVSQLYCDYTRIITVLCKENFANLL